MHGRLASSLLAVALISVAAWDGAPKRHASHIAGEPVGFRSDADADADARLRVAEIKCAMVMDPDDTDPDVVRVPVTRAGPGAARTAPLPVSAGAWQAWSRARHASAAAPRVAQLTCVFELSNPGDDGETTATGSGTRRAAPRGPQGT